MSLTIIVMLVALNWPGCQSSMPQTQPDSQQAATHADSIHALLDRLESSAADLHAFTAALVYEKEDAMLGRREIRTGAILYQLEPGSGGKRFAVMFDSLIVNNRKRDHTKHYVFDGRWLAEIDHEEKQFIKREIVPPGKHLDPLKLGEGPFPLPIGQSKNEVLARFEVSSVNVPEDGRLNNLSQVEGLRLIPKPETSEAKEFKQVDIFYNRETWLPVAIVAVEVNDDRKLIRLTDVKRNPQLTADDRAKLDITDPDPMEWRIDIRPWSERR